MHQPKPKSLPITENLVQLSGGSVAERSLLRTVLQEAGYTVSESAKIADGEPLRAELSSGLSPREQEVLEGVSQGLPDKAIASKLEISARTVRYHLDRAMRKLGAQNRTEAVMRSGLGTRFL